MVAKSLREARSLVKKRNIGEVIVSARMELPDALDDYRYIDNDRFLELLPELLHTTCWLSYLSMKCNNSSTDDILSDRGVLHEMIHLIDSVKRGERVTLTVNYVRKLFHKLQDRTIGVY